MYKWVDSLECSRILSVCNNYVAEKPDCITSTVGRVQYRKEAPVLGGVIIADVGRSSLLEVRLLLLRGVYRCLESWWLQLSVMIT